MSAEFEPELERGREKISDLQRKVESEQQKSENAAEAEKMRVFNYFGLDDFPNVQSWPSDTDELEKVLFKRFVSTLKKKLPKVVPYVREFYFESREVDEASLSEMTRTPFGQYLYTEFRATALVCIPSFSSIKVRCEGRFNRLFPLEEQDLSVHLIYSHEKAFPETEVIYWEDESDWDILLVKAREQCESVANARSKGFMGLK